MIYFDIPEKRNKERHFSHAERGAMMNEAERILKNLHFEMEGIIFFEKSIDPDIPVRNNFDEEHFEPVDFILGLMQFQIHHFIVIPDALIDGQLSLRQIAEGLVNIPLVEESEREEFQNIMRNAALRILDTYRLPGFLGLEPGNEISIN